MNFNTNIYLFIGCFLFFIGGSLWYLKTPSIADVRSQNTELRLGTMSGWPPYVAINAQGDYEGFDIDIAQEVARRLKKELVISDMDTAALIIALDQDKVDFIMTGLSITKERQQKITMIPYQGKPIRSYPLVFWKTIPEGVQSLEDLAQRNATICVEAGSSQDTFLSIYEGQCTIKRIAPSLAILELVYGKSDAVLLEEGLLKEFKKKYPDLVAVEIPLDENNIVLGNGIGLKKNNAKLTSAIERIIQDLKKEGFIGAVEKKWFGQEAS